MGPRGVDEVFGVQVRLIVFSDGHIGEYTEGSLDPKTGLNTRLLDTLNVWDWVRNLALSEKADLVVFGGDRFKPHNPPAWMRDLADERLNRFRVDGLRIACLLGNHDIYDKTGRWHSFNGVQVWNGFPLRESGGGNIGIFDKPGILDYNGIVFSFLPYGYRELDRSLNPSDTNILFFHDSVIGLSRDGKYTANTGIVREAIDKEEFSLIMGGHIHLRQELAFQNAPALHIGTPLERIQDGDQGPKGAIILHVDKEVTLEFRESPFPKVLHFAKHWNGDIDEILQLGSVEGNVVMLLVEHSGDAPNSIRRELEKRILASGAFSARVRLQAKITAPLNLKAKVDKKISIGDQIISYAGQVEDDPEVLQHLREIRERAG